MRNVLSYLRSSAIFSLVLVVPFMLLELVNRRNLGEGFPVPLFGFLWLLPTIFVATMMPTLRNVRTRNSIAANPISLLLKVAFWALVGWLWVSILIDQMPCFLGVPNCD